MVSSRALKTLFLVASLLIFPVPLRAQKAPDLASGNRVRVTTATPAATVRIGTVQAFDGDTLTLRSAGSSIEIPRSVITRIERSEGRKPNLIAAAIGLVIGATAGGAVGCSANRDDYGVFCGGQSDATVAVGTAIGAATGAVLGGFLFRQERWRELKLDR